MLESRATDYEEAFYFFMEQQDREEGTSHEDDFNEDELYALEPQGQTRPQKSPVKRKRQ